MGLTAHHGTGCPERIRLSATPFRRGAGNRDRRELRKRRRTHRKASPLFLRSLCCLLLDSSSNMTNPASPTLLKLASEAIVPLINGCAKSVGPRERLRFHKAIDYFGPAIAASWREWARGQRPEEIRAGLVRLGELSAEEARREATAAVTRFATASPQDQETAIDYLAAIPAG